MFIVCGTNSASTQRKTQKMEYIEEDVKKLVRKLVALYPDSQILFNSILPRLDRDDRRGKQINKVKKSSKCNI